MDCQIFRSVLHNETEEGEGSEVSVQIILQGKKSQGDL